MKIENLSKGLVAKNYKELCTLLGIEPCAGNSKKSQLKELERFISYHKEGNKFIVDEIYTNAKEKEDLRKYNGGDNNSIEYIKNIEVLILNLLAEENSGKIFLSKYKLLNKLKMINENYSYGKTRIPKLSKLMNIDTDNIYEFYTTTDDVLIRNLEKALNNLASKCLISWCKQKTVCEANQDSRSYIEEIHRKDEYDEDVYTYKSQLFLSHREATDEETIMILGFEKDTLNEMELKTKQDVIKNKLWNEFKFKVKQKLLNKNIVYYYDSYKILYKEDHVIEEITELCDLLLSKSDRYINETTLNTLLQERLMSNAQKRRNRALEEYSVWLEETNKQSILTRIDENYLNNNKELIDTLIDTDKENIKNKIKKQKLNVIENS